MKPSIGAITCIADSHIGHFDGLQIADAKAELLSGLTTGSTAILPRDDVFYDHLKAAAEASDVTHILSFGTHPESSFRLTEAKRAGSGLLLSIDCPYYESKTKTRSIKFGLAMTARHWALNAVCALAMCAAAGLDIKDAAASLSDFGDLPGRGKSFDLSIDSHHVNLIDDSYNAGPSSMKAALAMLVELPGRHGVILSDMLELGSFVSAAHQSLTSSITEAGIRWIIAIGPSMSAMTDELPDSVYCICHPNSMAALSVLDENLKLLAARTDNLLVKGSHGSGAHLISQHLIQTYGTEPIDSEVYHAS